MAERGAPRQRIIEAVFRLVVRGGVGEASLRKVAEESGINIGSVRHYFGNHEALLVAAAEEVGDRMARRIEAASAEQPQAALAAVCRAVLPVDPADRAELVVLGELIAAARLRPEFRPLSERMGTDLREVLRETLRAAGVADPRFEAERLTALISGLTFELVHPHGGDPDALAAVLDRHIAGLLG